MTRYPCMKKIMFSADSERIRPFAERIKEQDRKTLILWALDCGDRYVNIFEGRFSEDGRPRAALDIAEEWSKGKVKMPVAKKAIHAAHNAATDAAGYPGIEASARAVGHAAATVHVKTHAMGVVLYGLTSDVLSSTHRKQDDVVGEVMELFDKRLTYWNSIDTSEREWADFLNKEKE